jgi:hypothetical protein
MGLKKLPLNTWIVVDVAQNGSNLVSAHASRDDAEAERDRRNKGLSRIRYSACIAFEPVAERMGRACR